MNIQFTKTNWHRSSLHFTKTDRPRMLLQFTKTQQWHSFTQFAKAKWWYLFGLVPLIALASCGIISQTSSEYKTTAQISTLNALPIISIEAATTQKELEFQDYGWATHSFDIINGKMGDDGIFYVNEIDMEYYINAIPEEGNTLPLTFHGLYHLNDDASLGAEIPYVEGKGYGPLNLPYKQDDATVLNPAGYYESKYITREHYILVYAYGSCNAGDTTCGNNISADEAGKAYNFHIEVKAYQKVS